MWVGQPLRNSPQATATSATNGKVHSSKFTLWNAEQGIPRYKVQQSIEFIVLKIPVDLYGCTSTATTGISLRHGLVSCLASR